MTQPYRYPYRYESRFDNRLESVANAHTAADLRVRPVSKTALVSKSWAPRAVLRNTRWAISRNAFDATSTTSPFAVAAAKPLASKASF
jgi:hypothetical protein